MPFRVHQPRPPLDRAIKRFYCPVGVTPYRSEFVMPGPLLDMKINFGGPVRSQRAGTSDWTAQSDAGWCMGLWDQFHAVEWPEHPDYIGITFRPGGLFALFGIEAQELGNGIVPLDALLGGFGLELRARLAEAPNVQSRFLLLESLLAARIHDSPVPERLTPALLLMQRSHGMASVAQLATVADVSPKHLVSLFNRTAGAAPKIVARLHRLQHLLVVIEKAAFGTWTQLAHDFGYYDQPHFNKDFKRLTGHTPAEYLHQRQRARASNPHHAKHHRLLPRG